MSIPRARRRQALEAYATWHDDIALVGDRLIETGLPEADVSAITAGLGDVAEGLPVLLASIALAVDTGDRDALIDAWVEVDDHLRPHLRDLSRALKPLDRLLARRAKSGARRRQSFRLPPRQ